MARRYKTHSTGLRIFCVILALLLVGGITLGGLELWGKDKEKPSNWFKKDEEPAPVETVQEYETTLPANGGMILNEKIENGEEDDTGVKSNGIALMSAAIPVSQYAAYEISPAAETAKTVTATVSPDNEAANTKIKWELSWKDPASEWATGKEVTDYVTVQSNADDLMESKTCTVSCSQAFGEQIVLKAIAVDDEEKFATCNVDYVQQVNSVKVFIGDVSVNLGGNTDVTIAIRRAEGGAGGEVKVAPRLGDVYTIKNEFTGTVTLTDNGTEISDTFNDPNRKYVQMQYLNQAALHLLYDQQKDYIGEDIYFDTRFFETFDFNQFNINKNGVQAHTDDFLHWKDFSADEIKACYTHLNCQGKVFFEMKVTLTSNAYEYEYTYESDIVWAAIDETVPLEDVDIGKDIVFP